MTLILILSAYPFKQAQWNEWSCLDYTGTLLLWASNIHSRYQN